MSKNKKLNLKKSPSLATEIKSMLIIHLDKGII